MTYISRPYELDLLTTNYHLSLQMSETDSFSRFIPFDLSAARLSV